ncbi:hypothetical protein CTAYLR_003812 [Chrysophaeum taylorii]|uniref:CRAL-TRIO domain-containing protein n=1 Tax=Chrysophaeum taylorii TaxID=2483200 RepID=A0AAD7UDY6_9STRA|nr:hypothetical protein CTAYLR_003812 [Chrysophaeum taylorii]
MESTAAAAKLAARVCEEVGLEKNGFVDGNFSVDEACADRYLRARQQDATKAQKMLLETVMWRRNYFPLNHETLEKETNGKTYVALGDDDQVVVVMRNRLENTRDHDGNVMHLVYQMERAVAATKQTDLESWNLVIDFEGYSISNAPPFKTSKATLAVMQNHYPERLRKAYLVKAPLLFRIAFRAISPFIDPKTREKLVFCETAPSVFDACFNAPFDAEKYFAQDPLLAVGIKK